MPAFLRTRPAATALVAFAAALCCSASGRATGSRTVLGDPAFASAHDLSWIAILAPVTGAIALSFYYFGLRNTPAVAAA